MPLQATLWSRKQLFKGSYKHHNKAPGIVFEIIARRRALSVIEKTISGATAFTLAEVLIVLGIIGLIADMTIPTLINKVENQTTVTALKKVYSTLSQATILTTIENGSPTEWDFTEGSSEALNLIYSYYKPYLKVIRDCGNEKGCWSKDITKSLNGGKYYYAKSGQLCCNNYSVTLADGVNLNMDFWGNLEGADKTGVNSNSTIFFFVVDLNGDKKPNQMGKDVFMFVLTKEKGKIVPAGIDNDQIRCTKTGSDDFAGADCAAKVLSEGKINY